MAGVVSVSRWAKVAVGQLTATADREANFQKCAGLARRARAAGAALLCLPECFHFIGEAAPDALAVMEPLERSPWLERYKGLAKETGVWLSLGGFQEAGPDPEHRYNTNVLLDAEGAVVSSYRKIHLFDVDVPGAPLRESKATAPGGEVVSADSPVGRLGLTVCYDLRFPGLYQRLRFEHGCDVLLVPSAFTRPTGEAHWHLLLRARAVETQCYVVAAAQAGVHSGKRASYGHALIVDPWGEVVADVGPEDEGIGVAEVDLDKLAGVRARMPIDAHRRGDVYGW